jgi:hypothetical protein
MEKRTWWRGGVAAAMVLALTTGCGSAMVSGGGAFDAGTVAAGGLKSGFGQSAELIGFSESMGMGLGLGPSIHWGGYDSADEGEPIGVSTLEGRARSLLRRDGATRPFWGLGVGAGMAWTPSVSHLAIPLHGELGIQHRRGTFFWEVAVRERFITLVGGGSPQVDGLNSLQVVVGLGVSVGVDPRRPPP